MKLIELLHHATGNSEHCLFTLYYELSLNSVAGLEVGTIRERLAQARIKGAPKINISKILDNAGPRVDFFTSRGNKRNWRLTNSGISDVETKLLKRLGHLPLLRGTSQSLLPQKRINILFLGLSPQNAGRIRLEKECREIDEKIRASDFRDVLTFHTKWAVQPQDLFQHINQIDPDIIHISGHGDRSGHIAFEDQLGNAKLVDPSALVNAIAITNRKTRTVLFNACFSQIAAASLSDHIDCTIGMSDSINDDSAILFAASFYRALGFGKSVQQAYREGGAALVLEGLPGVHLLNLNSRKGVDPAIVTFASANS
jgi:hypothetical protein